jgi:hypothetical protein
MSRKGDEDIGFIGHLLGAPLPTQSWTLLCSPACQSSCSVACARSCASRDMLSSIMSSSNCRYQHDNRRSSTPGPTIILLVIMSSKNIILQGPHV